MEEQVLTFLKNQSPTLCVLSTASAQGKPESAVVGYSVQDDLTIIINTSPTSRKVGNVRSNPYVSFVTGWSFDSLNIQCDGTATLIEQSHPDFKKTDDAYFAPQEETRKFHPQDAVYIVIKPTWIRILDHSQQPWKVEEKSL